MSMISSIKKLDCLFSKKLPTGKGFACKRIVANGGMVVALLDNGGIWTNWKSFQGFCLTPGTWNGSMADFCRCLVGLGLITRKEYSEHMKFCRKSEERQEFLRDQKNFDRLLRKYGLPARKLKRIMVPREAT